ncbi:MAG: RNA methyltransferase [Firmicutes bacterium]|nr:RNA methyltransferase [Bacillota bacterium]
MLITSTQNPQIKRMRSLYTRKGRERTGLIPVEGVRFVMEALAAAEKGVTSVDAIFCEDGCEHSLDEELSKALGRFQNQIMRCSTSVFKTLSDTGTPQGIVAAVTRPSQEVSLLSGQGQASYLIVDRVQDPGNLGTMIRTAAAAGAQGIFCLSGTVDPYNSKTLRATMGSVFRIPIVTGVDSRELVTDLQSHGCRLIAADIDAEHYHFEIPYTGPNAIIIGNEGQGIGRDLLDAADTRVKIPLAQGVESLNAAVACGILLFEVVRYHHRSRAAF